MHTTSLSRPLLISALVSVSVFLDPSLPDVSTLAGGNGSGGSGEKLNHDRDGDGSGGLGRGLLNRALNEFKIDPDEKMLQLQATLSRLKVSGAKQNILMKRNDLSVEIVNQMLIDVQHDRTVNDPIATLVFRLEHFNRSDRSTWPKAMQKRPRTPEERGQFPEPERPLPFAK